jgi:hypothetical protein
VSDSLKVVVDSSRRADSVQIASLKDRIRTTTAKAQSARPDTVEDVFWEPLYYAAAGERDEAMRLLDSANANLARQDTLIRADSAALSAAAQLRMMGEARIDSLEVRLGEVTSSPKLLGFLPMPAIQGTCGVGFQGPDCVVGVGFSIPLSIKKKHNLEK